MNKKIIGITGPMASGKGTIADYFIKNHGAVSYRFSSSLFDICNILGMNTDRNNLFRVSKILREEFGDDILAIALASKVAHSSDSLIIVDGIRRPADIYELSKFEGFKLIYLDAPIKLRYERMKLRGEKSDDATKTYEDFENDHKLETELLIPGLKSEADIVIDNSGSYDDLYIELEKLLKD
jgi:dephospho-CoA kinase